MTNGIIWTLTFQIFSNFLARALYFFYLFLTLNPTFSTNFNINDFTTCIHSYQLHINLISWVLLGFSRVFSRDLESSKCSPCTQKRRYNSGKKLSSYQLSTFSNLFERVNYNSLFNYFLHDKLFTPSQSGFLPEDSCIVQLLSIIHEKQSAFDDNPAVDVKGILLDISKAFDKALHEWPSLTT